VISVMVAWMGMTVLAAAGPCTEGTEFEPSLCPSNLPGVQSVQIEQQGVTLWADPDRRSCHPFQLTEQQVRRFFRDARQAEAEGVHHTLPESPCSVLGRVTFTDGSTGSWRLDQFGLGWLERAGQERMVLYCPDCTEPPWAQ
jgi:hypothetical protein